jgi:hypothetical protein
MLSTLLWLIGLASDITVPTGGGGPVDPAPTVPPVP